MGKKSSWFFEDNTLLEQIQKDNLSYEGWFEPYSYYELKNLSFEKENSYLYFEYYLTTVKPKIIRYITTNYIKTPIYGGQSISNKRIYVFDKQIKDINRFCETQLFDIYKKYSWSNEILQQILKQINYIPEWYQWVLKSNDLKTQYRDYEKEKIIIPKEELNFKYKTNYPTNLIEKPSRFWVRLLLAPLTFGLSFKIKYISKHRANIHKKMNIENQIKNKENTQKNKEYQEFLTQKIKDTELKNNSILQEVNQYNTYIKNQIDYYNDMFNKKWNNLPDKSIDKEFVDLRKLLNSNTNLSYYKNKKGIYIIWNKTKNKYYIGQSKDIYYRVFNQHFSITDGEVKNIKFAKDWYDNDEFYIKVEFVETKDDLDRLEKEYIDLYNAFYGGYNKTSGNN